MRDFPRARAVRASNGGVVNRFTLDGNRGVVHQDVEAAKMLVHLMDQAASLFLISLISLKRSRSDAELVERVDNLRRLVGRGYIEPGGRLR
jgi:hypothetical protein